MYSIYCREANFNLGSRVHRQDDLTVKYNCHAAPVESSLKISKVKKASGTQAKFLEKAFCNLRKQVHLIVVSIGSSYSVDIRIKISSYCLYYRQ
jgi:hypothetical protein